MEEMILEFIKTYGWQLAICACSGIFVLGIFKFFGIFDKIEKSKRKYVYAVLSSILSISASSIYLLITKNFEFANFGILSGAIYAFNQTIYAVYENCGFRTLMRKFGNVFINIVAKRQLEEAKQKIQETNFVENETTQQNENIV